MVRSFTGVVFLCVVYSVAVIGKFEVFTEDKVEYKFFPFTNKTLHNKVSAVHFEVKARNDVHIGLTTGPQEADPMIEVVIGGWANTNSVIRRRFRTLSEKVTVETPGILSRGEYRGFWVTWTSGVIAVGREGAEAPFMTWKDPNPFHATYVGVHTGFGSTGTWIIEDPAPTPVTVPPPPRVPDYNFDSPCCKCCNREVVPLGYTTLPPAFTNAIPNKWREGDGLI